MTSAAPTKPPRDDQPEYQGSSSFQSLASGLYSSTAKTWAITKPPPTMKSVQSAVVRTDNPSRPARRVP